MRIFLEIEDKERGFKFDDYLTFSILTSYTPINLWVLKDLGINTENNIQTHDFVYKKVISVMEVITRIENKEFHGKVISIADGDFDGIRNLVIDLEEANIVYDWHQHDNYFSSCYNTYFIDLDELRANIEFASLSIESCFAKLLIDYKMDYQLHTHRHVLPSNKIINSSEYLDLKEV